MTSQYAFILGKQSSLTSLLGVVERPFGPGGAAEVAQLQGSVGGVVRHLFAHPPCGEFTHLPAVLHHSIGAVLSGSNIDVESITDRPDGFVVVKYATRPTGIHPRESLPKATVVLDPNNGYCIRDYDAQDTNPQHPVVFQERRTYQLADAALPILLNSFDCKISMKGTVKQATKVMYSDFKIDSVAPERLTLSYYGIPEPAGEAPNYWGYIAIGLVSLLLCGYFLFTRLAKR